MSKVSIGCRLPSGLIIRVGDVAIELAGQRQRQENSPVILLGENDYGVTEVDASFWEAWKKLVGDEFAPLKSKALFEASTAKEAKAKATEFKKEKTGHEPLPQIAKDIEAVK